MSDTPTAPAPLEVRDDSRSISLTHLFGPIGTLPSVQVFVEDDDDRPFWRRMFSCLDTERAVEVTTLKSMARKLAPLRDAAGKEITSPGKSDLMKLTGLGPHRLVAVDADYDLELSQHRYHDRLTKDTHVIHTTRYAIENHLLDAETLPRLTLWDAVGGSPVDWGPLLATLSNAVSYAVQVSLASEDYRDAEVASGRSPSAALLNISDLRRELGHVPDPYTPTTYAADMEAWKTGFEAKLAPIASVCRPQLERVRADIQPLHHLQGHALYEHLLPILKHYVRQIRESEEKRIKAASTGTDIARRMEELKNRLDINAVVYRAEALNMSSPEIICIQQQIRTAISK